MKLKLFLSSIAGWLTPISVLAHNDIEHSTETIWQYVFNIEHMLLYGLPTLFLTAFAWKAFKKNKAKIYEKINK